MKYIYEAARYLVGALFIFSGLIKVNDPVGTAIKLEEYFDVFAYDFAPFFEWFVPAALFLSVVLSVLEIVLGVALILGFQMRVTAWALLGLIVFFTFLTFYSAYFNKVTDCGCFGDAIKLTPWESFTKDIILLALIILIFINRGSYQSHFSSWFQWMKVGGATLFFVLFAIYCIRHLPVIDFRAYAIGNHLPSLMEPSEPLVYEYIMEKDGKEYALETYPTGSEYTFKAMNLVNPDAQPKITDLSVWTDEGEYTEELMLGDKLLIVIYSAEKANVDHFDEINELVGSLGNVKPWVLTASGYDIFEPFRHEVQLAVPYYYADATVLKTMARSNPAILLLSNGTVLGKWHYNDVPDIAEIKELLN
ncbi:BT_3928 family protein [Marinoscillum sp. MHG1-6]|uniref:BT_3928 family protein n=1 Tax=Marinoscillum sp. MHG1-6 TaxID=2959627 RepID=UPI0021579497|nr:BT_3928 family protein [Marinoscillum sp. MHG1-6]